MSHIIGIDLGTTNSTLAFASQSDLNIHQMAIEQQITETMQSEKPLLPSFYLFPMHGAPTIGWLAKDRGVELPERVITSAKSWLCHDLIDRRAPFLPLGECEQKKSSVEVNAAYLTHLKQCWEAKSPEISFCEQKVLITVPASFDPSARQLVLESAEMAHFPEVRLMEEPLAAFYSWLYAHQDNWRDHLKVNDTVLVIDVGGGTTDFSLISVQEANGDLSLERKAVGNHLLLGGDNIDLALAHFAQQKFSRELDEWQFQSLVHSCRQAKETLLGENAIGKLDLIIQGRGSRVMGGSLKATLSKEEIEEALVDGFFPFVDLSEPACQEKRSGIAKMGLPFARDPRITVQLANFLNQGELPLPTAVLFNGGTMKACAFQKRVLSLLSNWKQGEVRELTGADLDFGVSQGAVYYGWTHANKQGIRVKAATCRSYYIGVESAAPAIPGFSPPLKKVQLVPFGMEEGSEVSLHNQRFTLLLDEPAIFRFFSQNSPSNTELTELHPIETILHAQGEEGKSVVVTLTAKITELGVLEVWCVAEDGRKWKLEFDIREKDPMLV